MRRNDRFFIERAIQFIICDDIRGLKEMMNMEPGLLSMTKLIDNKSMHIVDYAILFNARQCITHLLSFDEISHDGSRLLNFAAKFSKQKVENDLIDLSKFESNEDIVVNSSKIKSMIKKDKDSVTKVWNPLIQLLIDKGYLAEQFSMGQTNPLHVAVQYQNISGVRELLKVSRNFFLPDQSGRYPIHYAVETGNLQILQSLLTFGESLAEVNDENENAIQLATKLRNREMSRFLYIYSLIYYEREERMGLFQNYDKNGHCLIHLAILHNDTWLVELLDNNLNNITLNNENSLHLAARANSMSFIEQFISKSIDVSLRNDMGEKPIHLATRMNNIQVFEYLLEHGAKLEDKSYDLMTPLLISIEANNLEIFNHLIKKGANILQLNINSKSALVIAIEADNFAMIQKLTESDDFGRLVNLPDLTSKTPLMLAVELKRAKIAEFLIEKAADLEKKTFFDQNVLHVAVESRNIEFMRLLMSKNKKLVNSTNSDGNTPLHLAAMNNSDAIVNFLCQIEGIENIQNNDGLDPLCLAVSKGMLKSVEIFVENNYSINYHDGQTLSPIHLASKYGYPDIAEYLLKKGADPSIRVYPENDFTTKGSNALDIAIDNHNEKCAELIIRTLKYFELCLKNRIVLPNGTITTPFRKLIQHMPELAKQVMDGFILTNGKSPTDEEFLITFNFEVIDDTYSHWNSTNCPKSICENDDYSLVFSQKIYDPEGNVLKIAQPYINDSKILKNNHPLQIMVESKETQLLDHPLIDALLIHKWQSWGFGLYLLNLICYSIMLVTFTLYMVLSVPPYSFTYDKDSKEFRNYEALCLSKVNPQMVDIITRNRLIPLKIILFLLSTLNLLKEIVQFIMRPKHYLNFENLIELFVYSSIILVIIDVNQCSMMSELRNDWQWELGTFALFLACMNWILFAKKIPGYGIYVILFVKIGKTFFKFSILFFLFIGNYALAFHLLLSNQPTFRTVWSSLIRTGAMMIGEIDYVDTFYAFESEEASYNNQVPYPAVTYVIYVSFMVIMCVILMNLMIGLAVDDIKTVLSEAKLTKLALQVDICLEIESLLPEKMRKKQVRQFTTCKPNFRSGYWLIDKLIELRLPRLPDSNDIIEKDKRTRKENIEEELRKMQKQMDQMLELFTKKEEIKNVCK